MKDFQVVSLSKPLHDNGIEIVLAAFSQLYNSVTFKHQRKMMLNLVCEAPRVSLVLDYAIKYEIEDAINLISYQEDLKNQIPLNATTLLLPTEKRVGKLVRESLSKDVPIVSYVNESVSEYIDHTCGVFIRKRGFGFCVEDFSRTLRMLYFDPEVRKLFHRGAKTRFQEISGLKGVKPERIKIFE